jgi:hypothetical protein
MPAFKFAGNLRGLLRATPGVGDILNTVLEAADQIQAGVPIQRAITRAIPVGAVGLATNIYDPLGVTNMAPTVVRLAGDVAKQLDFAKKARLQSPPITSGRDPRIVNAAENIMLQMWQDPQEVEKAAKVLDKFNSEAAARYIVDKTDPLTKEGQFSADPTERLQQLQEFLSRTNR